MINVQSFTFNPVQENTYVLWNEKGNAIIIDPGCYFTNEQEALAQFIKTNNLKPVQLINTHCHLDHVFGNKWVASTYNLELYIHPDEEKMLQMAPASGLMWGLSFDNYKGLLHFLTPDVPVTLDGDQLQLLLTPGHSPGNLCLYSKLQNFVIVGDALFLESIGRTDLPGCNHEQLLQSIRSQLFTLPDQTIVYSGHGPQTTIGHEKKHNPFLNGNM